MVQLVRITITTCWHLAYGEVPGRAFALAAMVLLAASSIANSDDAKRREVHSAQLPPDALRRLGTTRCRDIANIQVIGFLADNKHCVSINVDGRISIWDSADGRLVRTHSLVDSDGARLGTYLLSAATIANGRAFELFGDGGILHVWDPASNRDDRIACPNFVSLVAASRDGNFAALASVGSGNGGTVTVSGLSVYDLSNGKQMILQDQAKVEIRCLQFSPDSKLVAAGGSDGAIRLWDRTTGKLMHRLEIPKGPSALAFSADAKRVLVADKENTVQAWDIETWKLRSEVKNLPAPAEVLVPVSNGKLLIGDAKGFVTLWDSSEKRIVYRLPASAAGIWSIAATKDEQKFATAGADHVVRFFELSTGKALASFDGHESTVTSIAFLENGEEIASASTDRTIRFWSLKTGKVRFNTGNLTREILDIVYIPRDRTLVSGGDDGVVQFWNFRTGKEIRRTAAHKVFTSHLALDPAQTQLLTFGNPFFQIRSWNPSTGEFRRDFATWERDMNSLSVSPDGKNVVGVSAEAEIGLWDLSSGKIVRRIPLKDRNVKSDDSRAVFSKSGQEVIVAGDAYIRMINWRDEKILSEFRGHAWPCTVILRLEKSGLVATGGADGVVRVWNINEKKCIREFRGHRGPVTSLACSPDGTLLASGSKDTTVIVWKTNFKTEK
jgi:WD40 repeat protein